MSQLDLFSSEPDDSHAAKSALARAADQGAEHERILDDRGTRKIGGAYYTPPDVVDGLLDLCLEPLLERRAEDGVDAVASLRVLDPACGGGNFLVASGSRIMERMVKLGADAREARRVAFAECVVGVDIDPEAADICRRSLEDLADHQGATPVVVNGDSLLMYEAANELEFAAQQETWARLAATAAPVHGFDLVVGNPPFLSQLGSSTARQSDYSAQLKRRFGDSVVGYADPAVLFLLLSHRLVRCDGGVICMIQPQSATAVRDARGVRTEVLRSAVMRAAWVADSQIFDAKVDVYAPVIEHGAGDCQTQVIVGREFRRVDSSVALDSGSKSWAAILGAAKGLPTFDPQEAGTLGEIAEATADFRDQYYGLADHVEDDPDRLDLPPLVTSGSIDPAELLWGIRSTKFNKVTYQHPRIRVGDLEEKLQSWAERRLVPKVLLATQTKVLEAVVDEEGVLLPSVPVITITADPGLLHHIAALLVSPPVTLVAAQRHLGAGLSSNALKLSASDVLELPLPVNQEKWMEAAATFRDASVDANAEEKRRLLVCVGELMCDAFLVDEPSDLMAWWTSRLPKVRDDS